MTFNAAHWAFLRGQAAMLYIIKGGGVFLGHLSFSTCILQAHDELLRSILMPPFSREMKCVRRYLSGYN